MVGVADVVVEIWSVRIRGAGVRFGFVDCVVDVIPEVREVFEIYFRGF